MKTVKRASGVEVQVPDDTLVVDVNAPAAPVFRGRVRLPSGPVPMPSSARGPAGDYVVDAVQGQDMTLVDGFELSPQGAMARARARSAADNRSRVAVDLGENEDAVLLLEQDGVYSWHFARAGLTMHTAATRRGLLVEPARKRVVFDVDLNAPMMAADLRKRGPIADFFVDNVRGYVLKFVARWALGTAVKVLERNVNRGLVLISSADANSWKRIEDLSAIALPSGRSARVLLLVHGTFSSTMGSYGALTTTDWGKAFLSAALANYDLILGFDHATLGDDPLENAIELLAALESARWEKPPILDAVAFSRGALVLRSLVEYLLPSARIGARVRRAIFVGATNGGTELAEPKNWEFFVDLYTNLAVAGCRIMQMFPAATAAATVLKESIASLGALVKYMAVAALEDRVAPGLAAMVPTGEFVGRINQQQVGQPSAFASFYCIITSEFDASLSQHGTELPVRFVRWLLDSAAKELMGRANDLVVDVDSMSRIDPQEGAFIRDRLDFGPNSSIFHTVYFTRPEVVRALTSWLELTDTKTASDSRLSRIAQERSWGRPATADEDILVTSADAPFEQVAQAVRERIPSYVVVERLERADKYYYAFAAEELIALEAQSPVLGSNVTLHEALANSPLALREHGASASVQVGAVLPALPAAASSSSGRTIVFAGDAPLAVIPAARELSGANLKAAAERAARAGAPRRRGTRGPPSSPARQPDILDLIARRRIIPEATVAPVARGAGNQAAATSPQRDRYYFGASMPDAIVVAKTTSVTVTISRDALEAAAAQVVKTAEVVHDLMIIIQIIPKTNLEVIGDDRFEMPPLSDARSTELMFDVCGTNEGAGELWVIVRQGPTKLATLILRPQIVTSPASSVRRIADAADSPRAEAVSQTLPVLQIFERRTGDSLGYLFALDMGDGNFLKGDSPPFKVDRAAYVADMYKQIEGRWLSSKSDITAFNAEMRAYGGRLFDQLVPPTIQDALWSVRDQLRAIHVLSEEPFIPWELVHLKPPAQGPIPQPLPNDLHFFGQKGLVRWLHDRRNAPREIKVRAKNAYYAIPAYPHPDYALPAAQDEVPFLKKQIKAREVAAEANVIRMLLSTPGKVDLFHFSGHGEADAQMAADARILLEGRVENNTYMPDYLKADVVEQYARLIGGDGNRALVVLNACQVGRAGWQLTSAGGFAEACLRAGAGAFLGTLWAVGDAPARTFTEAFYQHLLAGKLLAEASIAGREAARSAGDATWLAYVVYGHPYATVRFS